MRTQTLLVHDDAAGHPGDSGSRRRAGRRRALELALLAVALEAGILWLRSGRLGGRLHVRCRQGHLFTTLWIPAASVTSLRLGPWRLQRCPVGGHWSIVTPVRESALNPTEREAARKHAVHPLLSLSV